jgi:predicted acetyltransferase
VAPKPPPAKEFLTQSGTLKANRYHPAAGGAMSALTIRPPATAAERESFYQQVVRVFGDANLPESEQAVRARLWRQADETRPGFDPAQCRAAYQEGVMVGGYTIEERQLRCGSARLRTGCIAVVQTHPEYRRRGIASSLMQDAIEFAETRGHNLLLLAGIPDFYHRFGYLDVFDRVEHWIERERLMNLPATGARVRRASVGDAAAVLALYRRHYGRYTGSFERSLPDQEHHLQAVSQRGGLYIVEEEQGPVTGYLLFRGSSAGARATEAAADNWAAALALLQYHARVVEEATRAAPRTHDVPAEPPKEVAWPLPVDSTTYYLLAAELPLRTQVQTRPRAGWMARLVDLQRVVRALRPEWQARWAHGARPWTGVFGLAVGADRCLVELTEDEVSILDNAETVDVGSNRTREVRLSPQLFSQAVFGYRPISWLALQPGVHVPADLLAPLSVLMPPGHCYIPGSDAF